MPDEANRSDPIRKEGKVQQMPQDQNIVLYRLEELERRLHQSVADSVQAKEYLLQIGSIKESVSRVETEVIKHSQQLSDFQLQMQKSNSEQKQSLADFQLKVFYGICFIIASVIIGVAVWYFTQGR